MAAAACTRREVNIFQCAAQLHSLTWAPAGDIKKLWENGPSRGCSQTRAPSKKSLFSQSKQLLPKATHTLHDSLLQLGLMMLTFHIHWKRLHHKTAGTNYLWAAFCHKVPYFCHLHCWSDFYGVAMSFVYKRISKKIGHKNWEGDGEYIEGMQPALCTGRAGCITSSRVPEDAKKVVGITLYILYAEFWTSISNNNRFFNQT